MDVGYLKEGESHTTDKQKRELNIHKSEEKYKYPLSKPKLPQISLKW